jgi:hypothetical protein
MLLFVAGVLVQEFVLMLQGLEALDFKPVKAANMALFYCALVILSGIIIMIIQFNKKYPALASAQKPDNISISTEN